MADNKKKNPYSFKNPISPFMSPMKNNATRGQQASPGSVPQQEQTTPQFNLGGSKPTTPNFDMNLGMPASLSIPNQLTPTKPTQSNIQASQTQQQNMESTTPPTQDRNQPDTSAMQNQLDAIKKQALGIQESIGQLETSTVSPTPTTDTTSTPTPPVISEDTQEAIDSAEDAILKAQKISPQELTTQEDLDKLLESTRKAFVNTQNQAIPLEFITGQLSSIEDRALSLAEPLEDKMARLQAQRQANLNASKFALERADEQAEREITQFENRQDREFQERSFQEDIRRYGIESEMLREKFDEDVRQFGLEYELSEDKLEEDKRQYGIDAALKQREMALKELESKTTSEPTANAIRAASTVVRDGSDALYLLGEPNMTPTSEAVSKYQPMGPEQMGLFNATSRMAASKVWGNPAFEVAKLIQSVKDNIGIDALLNIKREGSGLGQVPQKQLETLQGLLGRLDISRDPSFLRRDIKDVLSMYQAVLNQAEPETIELLGVSQGTQETEMTGTTSSGMGYTILE